METSTIDMPALLRERDWLRRLARGLTGDPAFAEDAVQETYLAALRHPPRVEGGSTRGWLATVLRHRVADHGRRRRREALTSGAGEVVAHAVTEEAPGPEALTARLELQRLVAGLVLQLPAPQREALLLCTLQGATSTEAAARLGVPAATVRGRVKDALDRLRAELDRQHGGDRKAWVALLAPIAAEPLTAMPGAAEARWPGRALTRTARLAKLTVWVPFGGFGLLVAVAALVFTMERPAAVPGRAAIAPAATGPGGLLAAPSPGTEPAIGTSSLAGTVFDPAGQPVPGALVGYRRIPAPHESPWLLQSALPPYVITDAAGRYRVPSLAPGKHQIAATSTRGAPAVATHTARAGEAGALDLRLAAGGVLLEGHLRDRAAGPVPGGRVLLTPRRISRGDDRASVQVLADETGTFRARLALGTYWLSAAAAGYARAQLVADVVAPVNTVTVPLLPEAVLSGRVLAAGTPLLGTEVVLNLRSDGRVHPINGTHADAAGRFTFDGLSPGVYQITARGDDVSGQSPVLAIAVLQRASLDVELQPALALSGTVRDEAGGALAGVSIVVIGDDGPGQSSGSSAFSELSDGQGRFRVGGLASSNVLLQVRHPGYAPLFRQAALSKDTALDLRLARAPVVSGIVRDSHGRPVAGARVQVTIEVAPHVADGGQHTTDPAGRFRFTDLSPGRWNIVAWSEGEVAQRVGQPVEGGRETVVDLRLEPGAQVEGQVVDERGSPMPHVQIQAQARAHPTYYDLDTHADGEGRFLIGPFLAGTASVAALTADNNRIWSSLPRPEQQDIQVAAGQRHRGARLVVAGRTGTIGGRVLDPDGKPLADARLLVAPADPVQPPHKSATGLPVVTDDDGRFRLTGLRGPRQVVWVEHAAYPDLRTEDVATGTTDLRLVMKPGGGLAGVVVTAGGRTVSEYELLVAPAALAPETPSDAVTRRMNRTLPTFSIRDAAGRFAIERLDPGVYELSVLARGPGLYAQLASVEVAAGHTRAGLRLVVRPGLVVRGQVVDPSDRPVAAELGVLQLEGYRSERTGADGRFELRGLAPSDQLYLVARGLEERGARAHVDRRVAGDLIDLGRVKLCAPPGP